MNKELVEKMTEAIARSPHKSETPEAKACIKICAAVASEHYADKWHKCSEQMPEEDEYVLVRIVDEFGDSDIDMCCVTKNGDWYRPFKNISGITHWMPLPQPPQQ